MKELVRQKSDIEVQYGGKGLDTGVKCHLPSPCLTVLPSVYPRTTGNMSGNRRTANIKSLGYSDLFCLSKEDLREVLSEYPQAQAVMEEKGREILLKMNKLDVNAEAAEIALQEATESRLRGLDQQLDDLQTKFARLLAELESSALKIAYRIERLEWQTREWPVPEDLVEADIDSEPEEGTSKDGEGETGQEGPPGP